MVENTPPPWSIGLNGTGLSGCASWRSREPQHGFAYEVLWIVLAYLNTCILASMVMEEGDTGASTQVSFQYLINELDHGQNTGRALPRSLQDVLTARAGRRSSLALAAVLPPPAPQTIGRDG